MDDIATQTARRNEFRRKLTQRKTYAERMRDMDVLQERMWATLRKNPAGYAHFLRRNFKARSISVRDANAK
jgi:transposase InsO family protein